MLNIAVLKSVGFWVAALAAIAGVLASQGVLVEGSVAATILGWIMTFLGSMGAGHQIATKSAELPAG